jgi:carboxylesterase
MPGAGSYFFEGGDVGCLLIHGFTGTPQNIRPLGDFLARRGFTVLGVRLAGHGTTVDEFARSTAEQWIGSVDVGLEQLKRSCSTMFAIGISMGGTLALHVGASHPEVAGVGCINGPVMDLPEFEAAADSPQTPERIPAPWTDPRILTKDLASAGITYLEIPKPALKQALGVFKRVQGELGQIRVPTILFFSRDDAIVSPDNGPFIMERLTAAPDKRLVELTDSAHEATLDWDLERIGLEWLAFLRAHSPAGARV